MTSEASSTTFGFPAGQVSFVVEDWQLNSLEVAELVVGRRSTVPLAFAWIGGVSEGSNAPELRPAEHGSYLVAGTHSADDEDEFLEIPTLPCPLIRDQRRGDPMGRPALTGTPASGKLLLVVPDGWADGWDEWMQGAPSPWPMFEIEVQAIRTCQYSGRSIIGTGDPIERSGTSLGRDFMIEGRLISLRPGDVEGYRRHRATRDA